jgi:hypothetical protein
VGGDFNFMRPCVLHSWFPIQNKQEGGGGMTSLPDVHQVRVVCTEALATPAAANTTVSATAAWLGALT